MMELVFLGTSSARPTQKRGLSCTTEILIFDVGEGAHHVSKSRFEME